MGKWNSVEEAYRFAVDYYVLGRKNHSSIEVREALDYCAIEKKADAQYLAYAIDYEEAIRSGKKIPLDNLRAASECGIPPAQYDLGLHLFYGESVERDLLKALELMELAASQGYLEACRTLVRLYLHDSRIRRNYERANYWKDKLEGGFLAERYTLHPLSQIDIQVDNEHIKPPGINREFAQLFTTVKQEVVIKAPYRMNLIVNAGPGTGKTYTLIQRIAFLVRNEGIEPSDIVVFSYTRAVVKELKTRLEKVFENDSASYLNVDISTFHKKAYAALKFVNKPDLLEDWTVRNLSISNMLYDDCMVYGAELLEKHPEIISTWKYVIIDEIQDINHAKAYFVLKLIDACIKNQIPYMLLGDSCQSIYDYLDDKNIGNSVNMRIKSSEFYDRIIGKADQETGFYGFDINENFRSTERIKVQALPVRKAILSKDEDDLFDVIGEYENSLNSLDYKDVEQFIAEHPNSKTCVLERSNIRTRYISTELKKKGIQNQCVISGVRDAYPQWIGEVFGGFTGDSISREVLAELFRNAGRTENDADICWNKILELDFKSSEIIQMKDLLFKVLAHEMDEVFYRVPSANLLVSNVHRSKGLEFDYVLIDQDIIMRPIKAKTWDDSFEEARVLYVAITRAKQETLKLVNTGFTCCKETKDGRHYQTKSKGEKKSCLASVEICQTIEVMDVAPECFIVQNMKESQKAINQLKVDDEISLVYSEDAQKYAIVANNKTIGWMKDTFNHFVTWDKWKFYPKRFDGIFIDGIYTHIGRLNGEYSAHERLVSTYCPEIGVWKIWNYISFSGLAHAVYDE